MKIIQDYGNEELSNLIHETLYNNLEECSFKYHQLIIKNNDELIGGLEYTIKNEQAIIHNLVIKPEHQRQGYGSLLVEEMISSKKFKEIIGQGVFNKGSLKIVNKLGFKRKKEGAFTYYSYPI